MTINQILDKPIVNLSINTALVYAVAYLGRNYFLINPVHAALFSFATFVTANLGLKLVAFNTHEEWQQTSRGRTIYFISHYIPATVAVASKVLSPLQAIAAMGLVVLCSNIYSVCAGFCGHETTSPWDLSLKSTPNPEVQN